jgi:gentisate 1,2-dioxygenase
MNDPRNRTHDEIRRHGGVGNLNEGIAIDVHGLQTRLIAWPGNGFQTQSVHVVTHAPGQESARYAYPMGEEAAVCLQGRGEVWLHDRWVTIGPGDLAFWPAGVEHATRNAPGSSRDFVLVTQLTPPPVDLYEPAGFYDRAVGAMRFEVIERARRLAVPGRLSARTELRRSDDEPDVRAWNLDVATVKAKGALFNVLRGAGFSARNAPALFALWPGYGSSSASFHMGVVDPGKPAAVHTHPVADEAVVFLAGDHGDFDLDGRPVRLYPHDVLLVPCGVEHGGGTTEEQGRIWVGGFAAPPQLDLYLLAGYTDGRTLTPPPWSKLDVAAAAGGAAQTAAPVAGSDDGFDADQASGFVRFQ